MRAHLTLGCGLLLLLGGCQSSAGYPPSHDAGTEPGAAIVVRAAADEDALMAGMAQRAARLGAGIRAFAAGDDRSAARHAAAVLAAEPDNVKARELAAAAARGGADVQREREQRALSEWLADFERNVQDRALLWPSRSFWERLSAERARHG